MFIVFMTQGSGHLEFGIDTKIYQPSLLSNDSACLALLVGISDHKAGGNKASYTRYMGAIDIKLRNNSWKPHKRKTTVNIKVCGFCYDMHFHF
jgi:hypothetical protein